MGNKNKSSNKHKVDTTIPWINITPNISEN